MPSTILRTRLEVLQSNLQDVKDVLDLAKRRGEEIEKVKDLLFGPDGVRNLAKRAFKDISTSLIELNDEEMQAMPSWLKGMNALKEARDGAEEALKRLQTCEEAIDALLGARVELSSRRNLQERLPAKAEESIQEVQSLLDDDTAISGGWPAEARLTSQSEPLFAEYVDLLRGLALRETGIERGICELADRLLDGCDRVSGSRWGSVAIPSYRCPSELTPAQIIRLGFPEWTVWALPLAAYEFGRIVASQDTALHKMGEDEAGCGGSIDVLADAFATYAVGPAYACAAFFMRLNPRPPEAKGPAIDGARAQMIFEVLRQVDGPGNLGVSLASVTEPLEKAWDEALAETGATRSNVPGITQLAADFWKRAERNYFTAKYHLEAWLKATKLRTVLQKRVLGKPLTADDDAAVAASVGDVRDMLNAAWLCRLEDGLAPEDIAREAEALWQETRTRPQKGMRFAAAPQRAVKAT